VLFYSILLFTFKLIVSDNFIFYSKHLTFMTFDKYNVDGFFDEMLTTDHQIREGYVPFINFVNNLSIEDLVQKQHAAERSLMALGITFNVYNAEGGTERIMPLDIIPRIIEGREWDRLAEGLKQRIKALNLFIDDVYNEQRVFKDNVVPQSLISSSKCFLKPCIGLKPPKGIWCHITGTDLIRDQHGVMRVLEDNLRCPSGVSYMLENREVLKRTFSKVLDETQVRPVNGYTISLREMLEHIADKPSPNIVVLTPGIYNSAYFEHAYLALQMGVELVQNSDLVVKNGYVNMRTTRGLKRVDVIYRRIDDTYLDPLTFNPESLLGVPGIFEVYKNGKVAIANAPGTGVADDKVIYAYVPKIIKYYLGEEAIIPNVPTYLCEDNNDIQYVLDNIADLVVKEANEAGGYGMLIGPKATKEEHEAFRKKIVANPRNYIAQPTIQLSRVPSLDGTHIEGRHVDLRPYILYGKEIVITPGGLTRVALRKGSLVVNSSQGGGSKDTWVLY
jgi:uncharacterized circularly permuted ATP-grasp superfamily protein